MNLTLRRKEVRPDGIFGEIWATDGSRVCVTLEHAYLDESGGYAPKIPPGTYVCVRGMHRLPSMTYPFETFEIKGVPGHTNLLFHAGNYNRDSLGCVLVGRAVAPDASAKMITNSRDTFEKFIAKQSGINQFDLLITGS